MPTHVALFRGINVAGQRRVAMARLREIVSSLGHTEVATYIHSGNVVFTPAGTPTAKPPAANPPAAKPPAAKLPTAACLLAERDPASLAAELAAAVAEQLEISSAVVVRSHDELAQVARINPYPKQARTTPRAVHAVFLASDPGPALTKSITALRRRLAARGSRDTATLLGRTLFLHTPDGFGHSELAQLVMARTSEPDATATARNWSTVSALLDRCVPSDWPEPAHR